VGKIPGKISISR